MVGVDWPMMALSMHFQDPLKITKGNNIHRIGPKPLLFTISIYPVIMNVYARIIGEILQDI